MMSLRTPLKQFISSKFADGKNIQFTICISSRPTLSITVTGAVAKAGGSLWWETETMEVESGSHRGQIILLSARGVDWCSGLTSRLGL